MSKDAAHKHPKINFSQPQYTATVHASAGEIYSTWRLSTL